MSDRLRPGQHLVVGIKGMERSRFEKGAMFLFALALVGTVLLGLSGAFSWESGPGCASPMGKSIDPGSPDEITTSFRIDSDEELGAKAREAGWRGNGTADNPYIIYNVNIATSTSGYGIYVGNTTGHFVIYRCRIEMVAPSADLLRSGNVVLFNVSHAEVRETTAFGSEIGIALIGCRNVSISDTSGLSMRAVGLCVDGSDNITVSGGSFYRSGESGIRVNGSHDVIISGPSAASNGWDGVQVDRSVRVIVTNLGARSNGDGSVSVASSSEIAVLNSTLVDGNAGISVHDSSNVLIGGNRIEGTMSAGVSMFGCNNVTVEHNAIDRAGDAVVSMMSMDVIVRHNTIAGGSNGIVLDESSRNIVTDNDIDACLSAGICIQRSAHNEFCRNRLTGCSFAINGDLMDTFTGQAISENTVNGLPVLFYHDADLDHATLPLGAGQVILGNVTNLKVVGQDLRDQNYGLLMGYCSNVEVRDCVFTGINHYAVAICSSDTCRVWRSTFDGCGIAVHLAFSDANEVEANDIGNCDAGIVVQGSSKNLIRDNRIADCSDGGVCIRRSSGDDLYGNTLLRCSFHIYGDNASDGSHTIAQSNTVNGRPVYLFDSVDMNDATVPAGAGQVILWNVQHAVVRGQDLSDQNYGLCMMFCSDITVQCNTVDNCTRSGIMMSDSEDCLIDGNRLSNCAYGIAARLSDGCVVRANAFDGNGIAIYLYECKAAEVYGNSASGREEVRAYHCSGLHVHDNSIGGSGIADPRPLGQEIANPAYLTAEAYPDHVLVDWSGYDRSLTGPVDSYRLTRSSSSGSDLTVDLDAKVTSYNDTAVDPYAVYTYALVALSGDVVSESVQVTVMIPDPDPPAVSIRGPTEGAVIGSSEVLLTWNGTDDHSGMGSYWVSVNGGEWFSVGLKENVALRDLREGENTVSVRAVANAGNTATATVSFNVDTVPPSVAMTSPANGSRTSSPVVSWLGSDSTSGVTYQVSLDGGDWTGPSSSTTVRFIDLGQGDHLVRVRATDGAGNYAIGEVGFLLDSVLPTITGRSPLGESARIDALVSVTFSEEMDPSSVDLFVGGVIGTVSWNGNTLTFDPASALEAGASYTVTVSGKDLAGNPVSESWTFTVTNLATLSGQVLDADGDPVAGATVTLDGGQSTVTDTRGRFSFDLPAGRYNLTVAMGGYQNAHYMVVLAAGRSMSLGAMTLAAEPSHDLYWAVLDVLVIAVVLTALLHFVRRR